MKPEVVFVGLFEGLLEYRCLACDGRFFLKPYARVDHSEKVCEDVQADGLTTLRPPKSND